MAPSLSKFTEVRERLIAQVVAFMGSADANYQGQTISYFDRAPSLDDIWAVVPALAIWWSAEDDITFITDERRQAARNTTSVAFMSFRGYARGDWNDIEALWVDTERSILDNPGLNCAAVASLWNTLRFTMEVQHKDQGQSRRCSFESTLAITIAEDFTQ